MPDGMQLIVSYDRTSVENQSLIKMGEISHIYLNVF